MSVLPLLTTRAARGGLGLLAATALAIACASDPAASAPGSDADAGGPSSTSSEGGAGAGAVDGAAADPPNEDDTPWRSGLEVCGNGIDDDGDGLVDEDCAPSFFIGVFPPGGGDDLASVATSRGSRPTSVVRSLWCSLIGRPALPAPPRRARSSE